MTSAVLGLSVVLGPFDLRKVLFPLSSKDLEPIQKRALAEGLPYQTLIASLLHK